MPNHLLDDPLRLAGPQGGRNEPATKAVEIHQGPPLSVDHLGQPEAPDEVPEAF
jgi:hypothetical protein